MRQSSLSGQVSRGLSSAELHSVHMEDCRQRKTARQPGLAVIRYHQALDHWRKWSQATHQQGIDEQTEQQERREDGVSA